MDSALLKDSEVELRLGSRQVCVYNFHAQYSTALSDVVGLVVIFEVSAISPFPAFNESKRSVSSLISIGQLRDHSKIYPTGMLRRVQLIEGPFHTKVLEGSGQFTKIDICIFSLI